MLDVPYQEIDGRLKKNTNSRRKRTDAQVVLFSACDEDQFGMRDNHGYDLTYYLTLGMSGKKYLKTPGLATEAFLDAMKKDSSPTHQELLDSMRAHISASSGGTQTHNFDNPEYDNMDERHGPPANMLQHVQLSCSIRTDKNEKSILHKKFKF